MKPLWKKKWVVFLIVAFVVLGGGLAAFFALNVEPKYNGKRVSEWFAEYGKGNRDPAREAMRGLGERAVPLLVMELTQEEPAWRKYYRGQFSKIPPGVTKLLPKPRPAPSQPLNAVELLAEIGTNARSAIPTLVRFAKDPTATTNATRTFSSIVKADAWDLCFIRALREIGGNDPQIIFALTETAKRPGCLDECLVAIRHTNLYAAVKIASSTLRDNLSHTNMENRAIAMGGLGQLVPEFPEMTPLLINRLASEPSRLIREIGLRSLGNARTHHEPIVAMFLQDLQRQDAPNYHSELARLQRNSALVVPALIAALDRPAYTLKENAIGALRHLGPAARAAIPALKRLISGRKNILISQPYDLTPGAILAIGNIGADDPEITQILIELAESPHYSWACQRAISSPGLRPAIKRAYPQLKEILVSSEPTYQINQIRQKMAAIGVAQLIPEMDDAGALFVWLLRTNSSPVIKTVCVRAVAEVRKDYEVVVAALIDTLGHADETMLHHCSYAFDQLGQRTAVLPQLVEALKRPQPRLRANLVWLFGNFYPKPLAAVPALKELEEKSDEVEVKQAVKMVLRGMGQ